MAIGKVQTPNDLEQERSRSWDGAAPHYERVFNDKMYLYGRFYRQRLLEGLVPIDDEELYTFEVEDDSMILCDITKIDRAYDLGVTYGMKEDRLLYSVHHHTILRTWHALGAPLFEAGPIMTEELKSMATLQDRVNDFIPRLMSRLPFKFFYFKFYREREGITGHIEGAYILNSRHNGVPALCIIVDDGFTLDPWYCEANTIGETSMFGGHHEILKEARGLTPFGNQRHKASSVLTVLHGLVEYLDSVDRESIDPTPAIRRAITSGKKSKVRKAINQMVGKRKIWIEPTLERKAREQGITGESLKNGHVRRGHLHKFYVGAKLDADGLPIPKERRKQVVKFVAPTWVGPRTVATEPKQYGIKARQAHGI